MLSRIISISALSVILVSVPQAVRAETVYSPEYTITVTARVLEHRTIIVDAKGTITQISSNTNNNITPDVHFLSYDGPRAVLTPEISRQYQHLMSRLDRNQIMVMDLQAAPPLGGLLAETVAPLTQRSYTVSPAQVGNEPLKTYSVYN